MRVGAEGALSGGDRQGVARLCEGCALKDWGLELGEPFPAPYSKLVAPARLPDGTEAVLKVQLPDDFESEYEADALRFWDGRGAVRLLAHDREERALLLERCVPGTQLGTDYDDQAIAIAAGLMRRIWRAPSTDVRWRRLDEVAQRWLVELPVRYERHGRPFDRRLLDAGREAMRTLGPSQQDVVLCHQDLHGGNILRAEREPWLAIDAKPIVAERAYDTVALVRDVGPGGLTLAQVRRRLDLLSELLGLDRERMRGWGIAKHVAWGLEPDAFHPHDIEWAQLIASA
jgi:streptomycin 6-kinase